MSKTVFVSGATGFIAQHIVVLLLQQGYKVVGSVRSQAKGEKLAKLLNSPNFSFEIVPDVEPAGAFDEALQKHPEVTVFLHTASPFYFTSTNVEEDLLKPAVNGTKNALAAVKKYGPQITNVVVTSSIAAIADPSRETDSTHILTEESWNPVTWEGAKADGVAGYRGSKKFAEKAAWNFVAEEKPSFVINYINPSFVFGPQAFDSEVKANLNVSNEFINNILSLNAESAVPAFRGGYVDVRDVAKAHLMAFEKPISNKRLLLNAGRVCGQDVLDVLNEDFPELKGKIPVGEKGAGKAIAESLCKIVNDDTKKILGFQFIDLKTSVDDTVQQILDVKSGKL